MTGEAPSAVPAASTPAPIPTDASAAQAQIATLKAVPAFLQKYSAGDADATARW